MSAARKRVTSCTSLSATSAINKPNVILFFELQIAVNTNEYFRYLFLLEIYLQNLLIYLEKYPFTKYFCDLISIGRKKVIK